MHRDKRYIILPIYGRRQFDLSNYVSFPNFIFMNTTFDINNPTSEDVEDSFNHACSLHENGNPLEALSAYRKLLIVLPNSSLLHFNCGLALFDLENFPEAEVHYLKASELNHADPDIHYNRGLNFRRLNNFQKAALSFESAFKLGDATVDTLYNLALCHQDMEEYSEAGRLYERILKEDPKHLSSLNNYAYLSHKSGNTLKAKDLYSRLLKTNPSHQAAKHMLNSLSGETPDTAPLDYVEGVFDNYAKTFEKSLLEKLQYKTPTALQQLYDSINAPGPVSLCLDLGCGTGLAGVAFENVYDECIGVDISNEMLGIASEKNIYKELVKDDIHHFLENSTDTYDIIVAADVFTYMGDLENVFIQCASRVIDGGHFLFSVEESQGKSFNLKTTGRFGHSQGYIENLCRKTGWKVLEKKFSKLRQDKNEWIKGYLFLLQKQ